jgi:hypothetical protein
LAREAQELAIKKQRQTFFHQQFEQDLETYRKTGFLEGR